MKPELAKALHAGPATVKDLAFEAGLSESRVREILKDERELGILCKKNDAGKNVFWMGSGNGSTGPVDQDATTTDDHDEIEPDDEEPTAAEVKDLLVDNTCPGCGSVDTLSPAGPEGSFLGAALTCSNCGKTYNKFSGDEIQVPTKDKAKRKPLNPQYKINAKIDAVAAEGGKLVFDRQAREWVLSGKKGIIERMNAKEFSIETPESLLAKI